MWVTEGLKPFRYLKQVKLDEVMILSKRLLDYNNSVYHFKICIYMMMNINARNVKKLF